MARTAPSTKGPPPRTGRPASTWCCCSVPLVLPTASSTAHCASASLGTTVAARRRPSPFRLRSQCQLRLRRLLLVVHPLCLEERGGRLPMHRLALVVFLAKHNLDKAIVHHNAGHDKERSPTPSRPNDLQDSKGRRRNAARVKARDAASVRLERPLLLLAQRNILDGRANDTLNVLNTRLNGTSAKVDRNRISGGEERLVRTLALGKVSDAQATFVRRCVTLAIVLTRQAAVTGAIIATRAKKGTSVAQNAIAIAITFCEAGI
mmetsp:Transcript_13873/g.43662  ORF Transcript_13873/g.43662 Transcript_13873/m.43662 type:complete len:263 (-) Transcript_13873:398-1186(-)